MRNLQQQEPLAKMLCGSEKVLDGSLYSFQHSKPLEAIERLD